MCERASTKWPGQQLSKHCVLRGPKKKEPTNTVLGLFVGTGDALMVNIDILRFIRNIIYAAVWPRDTTVPKIGFVDTRRMHGKIL